jgi:hypothetical protein
VKRVADRIAEDERELRKLQKADGAWGFSPQASTDPKDTDPAPTALALNALAVLGFTDSDPAVARGVKALLGYAGFVRPLEPSCIDRLRHDGVFDSRALETVPRA